MIIQFGEGYFGPSDILLKAMLQSNLPSGLFGKPIPVPVKSHCDELFTLPLRIDKLIGPIWVISQTITMTSFGN